MPTFGCLVTGGAQRRPGEPPGVAPQAAVALLCHAAQAPRTCVIPPAQVLCGPDPVGERHPFRKLFEHFHDANLSVPVRDLDRLTSFIAPIRHCSCRRLCPGEAVSQCEQNGPNCRRKSAFTRQIDRRQSCERSELRATLADFTEKKQRPQAGPRETSSSADRQFMPFWSFNHATLLRSFGASA